MSRRVLIRCSEPKRRDALEEIARLALAFVTVGCGPGFPGFSIHRDLEVHLTCLALRTGCHLPETAQELLESVQAFGVSVRRVGEWEGEPAPEWERWWNELEEPDEGTFELELEIV